MNFQGLKVLVLGDVCLDMVTEGPSFRQSPEAPVPVILNPSTTYSLGMAANVAWNLHNLGASVDYTFCIGQDEYGNKFAEIIKSAMGPHKVYDNEDNAGTTVKHRIVANNQQVARIDMENKLDVLQVESFFESLRSKVYRGTKYDLIIISDYNKGIITKESWSIMKPLLYRLSDRFFIDTKKLNVIDFYEGMYIFPNKKEMDAIMEFNCCSTRNQLRREMDLDFIVETASHEGAFLYKNDGKIYHAPVFKSNVVDVTGCGDTFVAAFSLYYTKYNDKKTALSFANYCCSKVIERKGTTPVLYREVRDFHDIKGF